jgi:hypothetical protein
MGLRPSSTSFRARLGAAFLLSCFCWAAPAYSQHNVEEYEKRIASFLPPTFASRW